MIIAVNLPDYYPHFKYLEIRIAMTITNIYQENYNQEYQPFYSKYLRDSFILSTQETHIHWPGESEVIQNLKFLHVIFSYTTIIIGCHEIDSTAAEEFHYQIVFHEEHKSSSTVLFEKKNCYDTSGCHIFQWHL